MQSNFLHKIAAAVLIVTAIVITLMGSPPALAPLKAAENIGQIATYNEDKIDPVTLAEMIISESGDYYIVDIRDQYTFADVKVPESVNIPFNSLMSAGGLATIPKYKKIVLVYDDGSRAGQAWTVMRSKGYNVFILQGGIKGWWDRIMTPASIQEIPQNYQDSQEMAAKVQAMRDHFSGKESSLDASSGTTMDVPPPPPPAVPGGAKKKKKSGGC